MIRWGVAGTGPSRQIVDDFRHVDAADVVAVSSRSATNAATFGDELDIASPVTTTTRTCSTPPSTPSTSVPHMSPFPDGREAPLIRGRPRAVREAPRPRTHKRYANSPTSRAVPDVPHGGNVDEIQSTHRGTPRNHLERCRSATSAPSARHSAHPFHKTTPAAGSQGQRTTDQGIYPVTLAHMMLGVPDRVHAEGGPSIRRCRSQ